MWLNALKLVKPDEPNGSSLTPIKLKIMLTKLNKPN